MSNNNASGDANAGCLMILLVAAIFWVFWMRSRFPNDSILHPSWWP